ncbi:hypothetical protein [Primorskyibacter sp. S87]|uniref:hypothetical protein n=1 Tax=Primorskyibacter sp. S87 TaxID=3415126 RepID=UPI003C7DFED3
MSDTDSFIDEVTEEVRRDRLYALYKKYGWIAVVVIVAIVGGAGFNEYRKSQKIAAAQKLGDDMITALAADDPAGRAAGLTQVQADSAGGDAVLKMMQAAALANSGKLEEGLAALNTVATNGDLPKIYRDLAQFKALTLQTETLPVADRRLQFEALAAPGAPLRLLAEEQLALIEVSEGQADAAIERLQALIQDAEVTSDLQQRASQLIVALGATPETAPGQQD